MTRIFISYSRKDNAFAEQLQERLHSWSYSTWRDIDNIPKGARWDDEIERALEACSLMIGIISPDSVASANAKDEWAWALEHKMPLILVKFKSAEIPMRYIRINYIDFTVNQEHGFTLLRSDLIKRLALEHSTSLPPNVRKHGEKYWQLCRQFFSQTDYALAFFFALTLIDETGTQVILSLPTVLNATLLKNKGVAIDESVPVDIDRLSREEKREMVIRMTMYINSRVRRLYPTEDAKFGEWFREAKLPELAVKALYIHGTDKAPLVPSTVISREDAFAMVCIAGEIYAEVQGQFTGVNPTEWQRILEEIDGFREKYRLVKGSNSE